MQPAVAIQIINHISEYLSVVLLIQHLVHDTSTSLSVISKVILTVENMLHDKLSSVETSVLCVCVCVDYIRPTV